MSDRAEREAFDYCVLDEQTREIVLRKTDETHGLMMRTAEGIIAIGENLLAVQRHLPDTKFSAWLRAEFDLSRQSAYNFMRVATRLGGSCKTVLQLPARVLYELASSPDAVIEQVEAGQLTPTVEAIKAAREAERQARLEVETRQAAIERLTLEIEGLRQRLEPPLTDQGTGPPLARRMRPARARGRRAHYRGVQRFWRRRGRRAGSASS